jgi:hypothetical protein
MFFYPSQTNFNLKQVKLNTAINFFNFRIEITIYTFSIKIILQICRKIDKSKLKLKSNDETKFDAKIPFDYCII